MALWQFSVHLVPKSALQNFLRYIPPSPSMDMLNAVEWFELCPIPPDFRSVFDELLPRGKSWSTNIEVWGDDEGESISIFYSASIPSEVFIRFDVRKIDFDFFRKVMSTAKRLDCLVFTEAGALFEPSLEKLVSEIKNSDASSFLENPQQFLRTRPNY